MGKIVETIEGTTLNLDIKARLSKDLKEAAKRLSETEARYLVDLYYQIQEVRKAAGNQCFAMEQSQEPHTLILGLHTDMRALERRIKTVLDIYTDNYPLGQWAKSVCGIGPILSAGLLANIEVGREYETNGKKYIVNSASAIWRYAGLDPSQKWEKGQKRPWNAQLKTLCWKIGESFVKVCNKEDAFYGRYYLKKKEYYQQKNEAGDYKGRALELAEKFNKKTESYKYYIAGKLPPGHIHAMAKRWAVKLFLSHYFEAGWRIKFKTEPPKPYAIQVLGHKDYIPAEAVLED